VSIARFSHERRFISGRETMRSFESSTVRVIRSGMSFGLVEVTAWVTQIIYAAKGWPVAVKVVNISNRLVWIDSRTAIARIVEHGFFPSDGHFVRPGLRRYREWETLIYENTNSTRARLREELEAQALQDAEPPCVQKPEYE
jgi:hypothetical protein